MKPWRDYFYGFLRFFGRKKPVIPVDRKLDRASLDAALREARFLRAHEVDVKDVSPGD